jgi:hypothetical protein
LSPLWRKAPYSPRSRNPSAAGTCVLRSRLAWAAEAGDDERDACEPQKSKPLPSILVGLQAAALVGDADGGGDRVWARLGMLDWRRVGGGGASWWPVVRVRRGWGPTTRVEGDDTSAGRLGAGVTAGYGCASRLRTMGTDAAMGTDSAMGTDAAAGDPACGRRRATGIPRAGGGGLIFSRDPLKLAPISTSWVG